MTLTLNKKNTVFYYIAIAITALLLVFFYYNTIKVKSTEKWVEHTQRAIDKNNEILLDIINIETGARGFLLTNNETFLEPYYISQKTINQNLETLLRLTKDNPSEQIKVKKLKIIISERIDITKSLISSSRNSNKEVDLAEVIKGKILTDTIRQNIKSINSEALSFLKQQKSENVFSSQMSKYLLFALFFLLLVLVFFIYYLFKNHKKQNSELESYNINQKEASQYSLSLIEASLDPLVTINNEGKITDFNQATIKVTGIDREHLIGSDFFDYFTNHQKAREVYQEVFSKGSVVDAPLTIRHKEGKLTDVLFNGSVYKDESGIIKGVVIVARDIAEQKWALDLRSANNELAFQNDEKEKRADELAIANKELLFQNDEKEKRAAELVNANKELAFQNEEKEKRADELSIANIELEHQNEEKEKRAAELIIANKELAYQNSEKEDRANELLLANEELAFQNQEKENRAEELALANKELEYQNKIKEKKAAELIIANKELAFQKDEKQNRADELEIANKELLFQIDEKQNRADELEIADKELDFQNQEKEKRVIENKELEAYNSSLKLASQYSRSLIEASLDPLVTISPEGKITDVNNASIKVTGVEREKLVGTDFSNYFTDPKKAQEGYRQVFENGFVEDYPLTIKHISGKLIDVLYNASVYKDDNNKVLGVFAAARDITEQNKQKLISDIATKNLEDTNYSLKLASQYSRSLIEASLDPLVTISPEGKITDVNNASIKVTGIERKKLVGTDFSNYFTDPKKAQEGYRQVFENGYVEDYPLTIKHISGKLIDVLYNASVYKDDNNKVLGVFAAARDITEQNKQKLKSDIATKNLEDSNDSLKLASQYSRSLIEASLDLLVTISPEGKITDVNNASIKVTGVEREKLVGTDFSNYFTDPKKAREGYRQVFENGFVADYPLTIKHKNGNLKDVLYNASVYKDDIGNVLGVFAAARDITEQNKQKVKSDIAHKNLETSNNSLKLASQYSLGLIESSRDPMFVISPEGKITDTNQASIKVTDVSKENLIGSDFIKYFTEPEKAKKGYDEVFSKGFVVDYPLTIKDHKLTDVLFNGSVYKDENGNIVGAVVVARDITEQKKAEKKLLQSLKEVTDYKLALDASTIVDITDKNGNILFVNENYVSISKYSYDELIGGNHTMVNSSFHPKEFMKNLWNTISGGKIWQGEIKNKNKDGQHYWLYMTIVPFLDEEGIPYQYVAISIDITNQKNSETQLTEAKVFAELATEIAEQAQNKAESATKIAEIAVKSKQQFLSNMSHEIRTPMNAIIGFTKVVLKTDLSAKQREYLSAIKMSGDALIVLINDILDLAKVDAGKMVFEKVPFKLQQSIKAMLHVFETKIHENNLKLVTQYDKNIPEVLLGDPIRLHQIILNLVSNAVKFTTDGTITVSINLLKEDDEKATVEFEVADTGIGISEEKLEGIFENFQQASSDTSRLYGGTGLGLAIVKQLVEPQGGTITVKSKVDEGSSFSFILDFPKTNDEAEMDTEIIEIDSENKNIKVLVVEDMALNQLLMKTILDDFGFERDIAENGQIAIDKLKTKSYDIVLMDLQMPVMNGFEATNYIRKAMNSKIPIIALTADVTTVDLAKCKSVGMDDYIAKPVDERLLYSKIIGLVKKPTLEKPNKPKLNGTADTKKLKYIDLEYLNQRTKANPQLMMEMISIYLAQTPTIISAMKQSLLDKDFELLHASMHKMIPSFSIMGISSDFEDIARKMQEYNGSQQLNEEIDAMALELEVVCDQACKELEIEYKLLKNTLS